MPHQRRGYMSLHRYAAQTFFYTETRNLFLPMQESKVNTNNQDPVVQSIVSLTISLRHKFVKQISAKVTNTLLFFVEKM